MLIFLSPLLGSAFLCVLYSQALPSGWQDGCQHLQAAIPSSKWERVFLLPSNPH